MTSVEQPIIGVRSGPSQTLLPAALQPGSRLGRCAIIRALRPSMKLIDVSVPLDANLPTYPGNTPFSLEPIKRIARGDSSNVSTLHMSAHTGTHVDAPRHFFDDGAGTEALPLELLIGRARVIEVTTRTGITADDLARARSVRRRPPADQDAQLAPVGLAGVSHGLRRRHRVGRAVSRRARHQGASASTTCRSSSSRSPARRRITCCSAPARS